MKILILLLSCNQERFLKESKAMKIALNNQIKKYDLADYIDIYDYVGDSEETYLNDSTIYINSKDNIENTYDKTIKCFQYIQDNIEYDYIFRTNTSTFINIKLLYEFIRYLHTHEKESLKVYSSALINMNGHYCPSINDICMQGRGILFNKSVINILLHNLNNFTDYEFGGCIINEKNEKIFGFDDVYISTCLNVYHINKEENYTDFIGGFLHLSVFDKKLMNEYKYSPFILFDEIKHFITISLKDDKEPNEINIEKIKFLDKIFIESTINDYEELIKLSIKYDENPNIFVGFNKKMFTKLNRNLHNKHTIALICTHYNHIDIAPFVLDYWKRFVTHAYIFDNGSNDGSLENFAKYNWITVQDMTQWTGGKLNDTVNITIKNNFWKQLQYDYDYIMICDFDEVLYCDDLERILYKCDKENIGMIYPKYCEMINEDWIPYQKGKLYHELNPYCHNKNNTTILNKKDFNDIRMFLINPKIVKETNYLPGQNINNAIAINNKYAKINNLYIFHLHYLGLDYAKKIHNINKTTLSDDNKKYRLGIQYLDDKDIEKYTERLNNKVEYYNYKYNKYIDF